MKGWKWQKLVGGVLAGVMTFSIMGTTLAVPVYAAGHDAVQSRREHREDARRAEMRRHQEKERRERYEKERRQRAAHDRHRAAREREKAAEEQRRHDKKVQQNQKIAAAAIGAIIGAVIAKNT